MLKITFNKKLRCFKAGAVVVIDSPRTLLVGGNGCGKSTLVQAIFCSLPKNCAVEDGLVAQTMGCRYEYRDVFGLQDSYSVEHDYDAAYIVDAQAASTTKLGNSVFDKDELTFKLALSSLSCSGGQATIAMLNLTLDKILAAADGKKSLLVLDEVDAGLAIKQQYKLAHVLNNRCDKGNFDLLCVTHCVPLIDSDYFDVYDLSLFKPTSGKDYLATQKRLVEI